MCTKLPLLYVKSCHTQLDGQYWPLRTYHSIFFKSGETHWGYSHLFLMNMKRSAFASANDVMWRRLFYLKTVFIREHFIQIFIRKHLQTNWVELEWKGTELIAGNWRRKWLYLVQKTDGNIAKIINGDICSPFYLTLRVKDYWQEEPEWESVLRKEMSGSMAKICIVYRSCEAISNIKTRMSFKSRTKAKKGKKKNNNCALWCEQTGGFHTHFIDLRLCSTL